MKKILILTFSLIATISTPALATESSFYENDLIYKESSRRNRYQDARSEAKELVEVDLNAAEEDCKLAGGTFEHGKIFVFSRKLGARYRGKASVRTACLAK